MTLTSMAVYLLYIQFYQIGRLATSVLYRTAYAIIHILHRIIKYPYILSNVLTRKCKQSL